MLDVVDNIPDKSVWHKFTSFRGLMWHTKDITGVYTLMVNGKSSVTSSYGTYVASCVRALVMTCRKILEKFSSLY
jgi:hypothetical protein